MYKTTDGGSSWTDISTGLTNKNVGALAISASNSQTVYAGTNGGGVFAITFAPSADFDGNGIVDLDDFFMFAAAFGQVA